MDENMRRKLFYNNVAFMTRLLCEFHARDMDNTMRKPMDEAISSS
jgi:histidinol phosphatase-like enzyme